MLLSDIKEGMYVECTMCGQARCWARVLEIAGPDRRGMRCTLTLHHLSGRRNPLGYWNMPSEPRCARSVDYGAGRSIHGIRPLTTDEKMELLL